MQTLSDTTVLHLMYCIVAEAVASKSDLQLNGRALEVTPLRPRPPPPLSKGPFEFNSLLLYGVSATADSDCIKEFLQSSGAQVQDFVFGIEPGKAMVLFDREPSILYNMHLCTN
jgi:hypothetical protein